MIEPYQIVKNNRWFICNPALKKLVENDWFDQDYWLNQGRLLGANSGRGTTWTIKSEQGKWILRHYYRGGFYARLNKDQYFWTGIENTRAFKEFKILSLLQNLKLPAPKPVAARVEKKYFYYRTDLIMSHIPHQATFASSISQNEQQKNEDYFQVGKTIARFHQNNIYHSDLNAHNILLNKADVYLIDFDKGKQMTGPGKWQINNLNRLKRSIEKITDLSCQNELRDQWSALNQGYNSQ